MQPSDSTEKTKEKSHSLNYHCEYSLNGGNATVPGSLLPEHATLAPPTDFEKTVDNVANNGASVLPPRRTNISKKTQQKKSVQDDLLALQEQLVNLLGEYEDELAYTAYHHPVKRFMLHRQLNKKAKELVEDHAEILNPVQRGIALDVFHLMLDAK